MIYHIYMPKLLPFNFCYGIGRYTLGTSQKYNRTSTSNEFKVVKKELRWIMSQQKKKKNMGTNE